MLQAQLKKAQSVEDLIRILLQSTGYELLPDVLFDEKNDLKNFRQLFDLVKFQLHQIENTFIFKANLQKAAETNWKKTEVKTSSTDVSWFKKEFGFEPSSVKDVRVFLLNQHSRNLHWFVNSNGEIWDNMLQLIACIRKETSQK